MFQTVSLAGSDTYWDKDLYAAKNPAVFLRGILAEDLETQVRIESCDCLVGVERLAVVLRSPNGSRTQVSVRHLRQTERS